MEHSIPKPSEEAQRYTKEGHRAIEKAPSLLVRHPIHATSPDRGVLGSWCTVELEPGIPPLIVIPGISLDAAVVPSRYGRGRKTGKYLESCALGDQPGRSLKEAY